MNTKLNLLIYSSLVVFILDQLFKYLARLYLAPLKHSVNFIPHFIDLKLIYNTGISFGFFSHNQHWIGWLLLSTITVLIVIYIVYYVIKNMDKLNLIEVIGFGLIIGGALGNAFDRIFFKKVTDYMVFRIYDKLLFINNFADDAISIGVLLLLASQFIFKKR